MFLLKTAVAYIIPSHNQRNPVFLGVIVHLEVHRFVATIEYGNYCVNRSFFEPPMKLYYAISRSNFNPLFVPEPNVGHIQNLSHYFYVSNSFR